VNPEAQGRRVMRTRAIETQLLFREPGVGVLQVSSESRCKRRKGRAGQAVGTSASLIKAL
jgi:hypothetical protein